MCSLGECAAVLISLMLTETEDLTSIMPDKQITIRVCSVFRMSAMDFTKACCALCLGLKDVRSEGFLPELMTSTFLQMLQYT
jgi:hypothetical protein